MTMHRVEYTVERRGKATRKAIEGEDLAKLLERVERADGFNVITTFIATEPAKPVMRPMLKAQLGCVAEKFAAYAAAARLAAENGDEQAFMDLIAKAERLAHGTKSAINPGTVPSMRWSDAKVMENLTELLEWQDFDLNAVDEKAVTR